MSYLLRACLGLALVCAGPAVAAPVVSDWPPAPAPAESPGASLVASAGLGGLWAAGEPGGGVRVYDTKGTLRATISRASILALRPAGAGPDGPACRIGALTLSESGRVLLVALRDDAPGASDCVIAFDTDGANGRRLFSADLGSVTDGPVALAHFRGRVYVGARGPAPALLVFNGFSTVLPAPPGGSGGAGSLTTPLQTVADAQPVVALAVDRASSTLFVVRAGRLWRASLNLGGAVTTPLVDVGPMIEPVTAMTFGDVFGAPAQRGLYLTTASGAVRFIPVASALGQQTLSQGEYAPAAQAGLSGGALGASATPCGGLIVSTVAGPRVLRDDADTRLSLDAFLLDEVRQVVNFGRGLIAPDGELAGWVIDADVQPSWTRFHPATPDGAGWAVLLTMLGDEFFADADAQAKARTILARYAGRLPGPAPSRNADGIFRHWIDPVTGQTKPGWSTEFATLSTMKIVAAASRAAKRWPADADIRASAQSIICGVTNWAPYVNASNRLAFIGQPGGGADAGSFSTAFNEGVIFVEQAGIYGSPATGASYANVWRNRLVLPSAQYAGAAPALTGDTNFAFQASFVSLYSMALQADLRTDPLWRLHWQALRTSHAMWTDDYGPRWFTVFSAGTTKPEWGGYRADSLSSFTGRVSTFPSLLALAGRPDTAGNPGAGWPEAVAAYHAYRTGARRTFRSGASILWRRSSEDQAWLPTDGGLPDIAIGALGLAELLRPGVTARLLNASYPPCGCLPDISRAGQQRGRDGELTADDIIVFVNAFFAGDHVLADISGPGQTTSPDGELTADDLIVFINRFFAGCAG
jgi:hypothetical protein